MYSYQAGERDSHLFHLDLTDLYERTVSAEVPLSPALPTLRFIDWQREKVMCSMVESWAGAGCRRVAAIGGQLRGAGSGPWLSVVWFPLYMCIYIAIHSLQPRWLRTSWSPVEGNTPTLMPLMEGLQLTAPKGSSPASLFPWWFSPESATWLQHP